MEFSGTYTALVTPFLSSGDVDYEGLRNNIRFQIAEGITGIVPLGTTGETPTLSEYEQEEIIKIAVGEGKGKVKVMVGTGSNSTHHTIENTKRAKKLGADMALIVTPYYNKPTQEGIFQHFKAVTEAVDIPVVVYNIQGRTGINIETATLKRIASLKNIIGVKEASGNINQMGDVIAEIQDKSQGKFSVLSGDDGITVPMMALGGRGVVSVVSNLLPGKVVRMVNAALSGNVAEAKKLHYEMLPLFKGAFIETNPIPVKAAMDMCGMPAGTCRLPLCAMQPENREKLKKILGQMGVLP
ncbi:4-hydroxy-tetrahydrodipicolinate synthase [Candidatus Woesearchaeota archaeon]|nr:4-hydroxy-tetrahydrodipicolinate synthase [Candidatus Woesearchaeota archaeon]